MQRTIVALAALASVSGIACSKRVEKTSMEATNFFATPPKPQRAFLSGYKAAALDGKFGIRIETEPLSFADRDVDRELEPEILLEYLSLPSIEPAKLENTRFAPDSNYEGSLYFLGEHNWVDLKEIRFLNAEGNSILAEYDLVIDLPEMPPNDKYPITLRVQTEIETDNLQLEPSRVVEGLGTLVQVEDEEIFTISWKGNATYDGHDVEIELAEDAASFEEIAAFARSVIRENRLPRSRMNEDITRELRFLADKFNRLGMSKQLEAEDFIPRRFYFYKRRNHDNPELILGLDHPADVGGWSLSYSRIEESGTLNWSPRP